MSASRPSFSHERGANAAGSSRVESLKARALRTQMPQEPANVPEVASAPIGRRGAPRLRLSIPAKVISLYGTTRCILLDLSTSGAQLGLEEPLQVEETVFLHIAGYELFCEVVRLAYGPNGGVNGLVFDPPLQNQDVLNMRAYAESYQAEELRGLRSEVKDWVAGAIEHT